MLNGKKIILGICGSIAAYKTATLVRLLVKVGADVQVIMTPEAIHFITPLTLSISSILTILIEALISLVCRVKWIHLSG